MEVVIGIIGIKKTMPLTQLAKSRMDPSKMAKPAPFGELLDSDRYYF